jgi:hypothetical protein
MKKALFIVVLLGICGMAWASPQSYVDARIEGTNGATAMDGDKLRIVGTEDDEKAVTTVRYAHKKIHEGKMYEVSALSEGLANGATLDLYVIPSTNQELHAEWIITSEASSIFGIYRNNSIVSNGTPLVEYNVNDSSTNTSGAVFFRDPTFAENGLGELVWIQLLSGGSAGLSFGASGFSRGERVMTDSVTNYVFRIVNIGGALKDVSGGIRYYTENK